MGRQVLFHMLPPDCEQFMKFVREHDGIVIVEKDSDSVAIEEVRNPCNPGHVVSLWNPKLLPALERKYIAESSVGPYYRVDSSLPVIEFFLPRQQEWDGSPSLTQGRVYTSFDHPSEGLRKWFETTARWIRKNFAKSPIPSISGYIGPAALKWHQEGGLLLPMNRPPVNDQWRAFLQPQLDRRKKVS
jgi:hypothetical protein